MAAGDDVLTGLVYPVHKPERDRHVAYNEARG